MYPVTFANPANPDFQIAWQPAYRDDEDGIVAVLNLSEIPEGEETSWVISVREPKGWPAQRLAVLNDRNECLNLLAKLFGKTRERPAGSPRGIVVSGSDGTLQLTHDGIVPNRFDGKHGEPYPDILRFDLDEFHSYYGELTDSDILFIGYWNKDGTYVPPEAEARQNHDKELQARATEDLVSNLAAALETCLAHYGRSMPNADVMSRQALCDKAREWKKAKQN